MATITVNTTQNIALEYPLAGIGERLVAGIIDMLIIIGYIILISFLISAGFYIRSNTWIIILLYMPVAFYSLLSELLLNGQTAGKKIMGIKVISIQGNQARFSQYLIRWLFRIVDFWLFGFVVGIVCIAASAKQQRIGDMVAGTTLIKTKPQTSIQETLYVPVEENNYVAIYPEVIKLNDKDIQLLKEIIINVHRTQNLVLAWQAKEKVEDMLHIKSKQEEPMDFLYALIADYNHLSATA